MGDSCPRVVSSPTADFDLSVVPDLNDITAVKDTRVPYTTTDGLRDTEPLFETPVPPAPETRFASVHQIQ